MRLSSILPALALPQLAGLHPEFEQALKQPGPAELNWQSSELINSAFSHEKQEHMDNYFTEVVDKNLNSIFAAHGINIEAISQLIPFKGRALDVGAGRGDWAATAAQKRPDLIIDTLDVYPPVLLPFPWKGKKIISTFQDFKPSHKYDFIHSHQAFDFLKSQEFHDFFNILAQSLNPEGKMFFQIIIGNENYKFLNEKYVISTSILNHLIDKNKLKILNMEVQEKAKLYNSVLLTLQKQKS